MRLKIFICLLLCGVTLAIYWPAGKFGPIYLDDGYFLENPHVTGGLTCQNLWWALSGVVIANWHPVTNLSFLLVHQLFGKNPNAEHWVNILFHMANAALLFLVLNRLTKSTWRSAIVAAIFAWHPLRVESVAWIAERKDVLCGFFFLLSLFCYARSAAHNPKAPLTKESLFQTIIAPIRQHRWALLFFVLALMSKPMAVSLPLLLLLLDYWPLKRFTLIGNTAAKPTSRKGNEPKKPENVITTMMGPGMKRLIFEKWPFVVLSALMCLLTYVIQNKTGAMMDTNHGFITSINLVDNAILSYGSYLGKFLWPTNLAVIYSLRTDIDPTKVWLTGGLLLTISASCVLQARQRPYLLIGWLWYLISCVPIIGLVQVGIQSMADRYTYLPLIGPAVSAVWLATEWAEKLSAQKKIATATGLLLCILSLASHQQVEFWRNTVSLFQHAVDVTKDNYAAQYGLGTGYELELGMTNAAMTQYRIAATMNRHDPRSYLAMANVLSAEGRLDYAADVFRMLVRAKPDDVSNLIALEGLLVKMGKTAEADSVLEKVLQIDPDNVAALNDLAWTLATSPDPTIRDGPRAVQLAQHACELTHFQQTIIIGTLAAAEAEAGRFDDAIATAQKAISVGEQNKDTILVEKNQELLALYQAHKPYHEVAQPPAAK